MSKVDTYKSRVLILGHEQSLLASRKWLLQRLDCECITVSTLAEYRQQILHGNLHLIILCQTSSFDECASASNFAAEHLPNTQLLIMFSRHLRCEPEQDYVLLDAAAGPDAFLQTAGRLLTQAVARAASTV